MKKVKFTIVLMACLLLTGCIRIEEPEIEVEIDHKVSYINEQNIPIYFNAKNDINLNALSQLKNYNQLSDIELTEPYTFIGYNVEVGEPTKEDIETLQHLLEQDEKLFSVCFFGTKDYNYLKPILSNGKDVNYPNDDTIAYCFGNFNKATVEYKTNISNDIVKDKLQYQNAILRYIEKQHTRYLIRTDVPII